ncbi:hypothetical protein [Puniceibacterium sediminis]|uniref:Uncharacterized protein n=1 Tax=Puniceibacterium sediminis TaxID=1608407 RepID=A0A238W031_9RHOB|nr:hypothetical protein [Puniceibacterium sediminis]SNR39714.1 hypothetical protein SAMN06265370_1042 [Puniceibacterium sediminis]
MTEGPCIDVWDLGTFDEDLRLILDERADLIRDYFLRERVVFETYDLAQGIDRPSFRPPNRLAPDFIRLNENLIAPMEERRMRAFHYTRMTDFEVTQILENGIQLSTPESLRHRIGALVRIGALALEDAEMMESESPFHTQMHARCGKFWMASHPIPIENSGVDRLLEYWGGEVASFHLTDEDLLERLAMIGQPRVIEISVPLSATKHSISAAQAVVATFGRSLGCPADPREFDLYIEAVLPAEAILSVHTIGDVGFKILGKTYQPGFMP